MGGFDVPIATYDNLNLFFVAMDKRMIRLNTNAARYFVSLPVFDMRLISLYFRLKPLAHHQAGKFSISQFKELTSGVKSSRQKWKLLNGLIEKSWVENLGNGWYRIKSQQKIKEFKGRTFVQLEYKTFESISCNDVSILKAICLEIITTQQNARQRKVARGYTKTNAKGERERVPGNRKVLEFDGLTSLEMQANYLGGCSLTEVKRLREKQVLAIYYTEKPKLIRFCNNQYDRETIQAVFEIGYKNRTENDKIKGKFFLINNSIFFCALSQRRSLFKVKRR